MRAISKIRFDDGAASRYLLYPISRATVKISLALGELPLILFASTRDTVESEYPVKFEISFNPVAILNKNSVPILCKNFAQ